MTFRAPRPLAPVLIAALALTMSGCSDDSESRDAPPPSETAVAAAPPATAGQQKNGPANPAAATPAKTGGPALTGYVGKYLFDEVDGVAFSDHPLVKAGIAATVTDARVRQAITSTPGPSAPIEMIDGKVASWSCQQHKCGEHQWMILVDPATGATDVCYVNDPAMTNESRWFLASGKEETRQGDCSSEKGG